MMKSESVLAFLLGCALGFIIGFLANGWRQKAKEQGQTPVVYKHWYSRFKLIEGSRLTNLMAFFVVALTVWAAITSGISAGNVAKQQEDNTKAQSCTVKFLNDTISALGARTQYSVAQNQANTDLQAAQAKFLSVVDFTSTSSAAASALALKDYKIALTQFQAISDKSKQQITLNAYPTNTELQDCLHS